MIHLTILKRCRANNETDAQTLPVAIQIVFQRISLGGMHRELGRLLASIICQVSVQDYKTSDKNPVK